VYFLWGRIDLETSPNFWKGPVIYFNQALEITKNRELRWRLHLALGRALKLGGEVKKAAKHFNLGMAQLKNLYLSLPNNIKKIYAENRMPSSLLAEAGELKELGNKTESAKGGSPLLTAENNLSKKSQVENLVLGFQGELETINTNTLRKENYRLHQLIEIYQKIKAPYIPDNHTSNSN